MKSIEIELETLFKESIEEEETSWTHRSTVELQSRVVENNQESTQIYFSENTIPLDERLSETSEKSNSSSFQTILAITLWLAGTAILLWAVKDLLGF